LLLLHIFFNKVVKIINILFFSGKKIGVEKLKKKKKREGGENSTFSTKHHICLSHCWEEGKKSCLFKTGSHNIVAFSLILCLKIFQ